jgi:hypothetical protein
MTNIKNMKEGFSKNYKLFSLFLITTEPKEVFIGQKMKEGKRKEKNEFFFCVRKIASLFYLIVSKFSFLAF